MKANSPEFWIDLSRLSSNGSNTFLATGRAVRAGGTSATHTFCTYEDLKEDLENLGVELTYIADRQLSGGLHATVQCDERTLRLLGIWEPVSS